MDQLPGLLAILPVETYSLVADPIRPRMYTIGPDGIKMIDTRSLEVINLFSGHHGTALTVSADGSYLLVPDPYGSPPTLKKIDLTTLELLPAIPLPDDSYSNPVLEGLDGRDYIAGISDVKQFDAATGALQASFATGIAPPTTAISPDRKTLFVSRASNGGGLSSYDISTEIPHRLHRLTGFFGLPTPSPDGRQLYYSKYSFPFVPIMRTTLPELAPAVGFGAMSVGTAGIAVGPDGKIYQSYYRTESRPGSIFVYDPISLQCVADIEFSDLITTKNSSDPGYSVYEPFNGVLDGSGRYLFSAVQNSGDVSELWMFSTDFANYPPPPRNPTKNLLNVSTRTFDQGGSDPMIGGFIVQGPKPKKVLIRGIGPSLPITGAMSNPVLDLYDSSGILLTSNDNWISNRIGILQTQAAPSSEREAAIVRTLQPGAYTAVVR
ncbi:MAG: hypothetical protein ACRD5Z_01745, partial [Bryobacteraceae bacterium]